MTCIDFKLKEYLPLKSKFELVPLLSTIKLIPSSNKLSKKHYLENGKYPIVDQGNSLISGYTNENNPISIIKNVLFLATTQELLNILIFHFILEQMV